MRPSYLSCDSQSPRYTQPSYYVFLRPPLEDATMRLRLDKDCDALYLRLDDSEIGESEEVKPGVILDFNAEGKVVGVEILNLSERVPAEQLRILQFET